jgi:hypothetical protein
MRNSACQGPSVSFFISLIVLGITRPPQALVKQPFSKPEGEGIIIGKNYFRDADVNLGHYSKKREGVADVDPKVSLSFLIDAFLGYGAI